MNFDVYLHILREASASLLVPTNSGNAKASNRGSEQQVRLSRFLVLIIIALVERS